MRKFEFTIETPEGPIACYSDPAVPQGSVKVDGRRMRILCVHEWSDRELFDSRTGLPPWQWTGTETRCRNCGKVRR